MPDQLALNVHLRADATFAAFVPAAGQDDLVAGLRAFAGGIGSEVQWYVWGAAQTGKTHLAQAACHAAAQAGLSTAYLPLREFSAYGVEALDGMAGLGLLALDDADRVWADTAWAHSLFALINAAREQGTRLLFTASVRPPDEVLPDLRSRLLWGPVYQLQRLTDPELETLIQHAATLRGFALGDSEVQYLLRHGPREPRGLIALLERVDQASLRAKRKVTVPFIRTVLETVDVDTSTLRPVNPDV
ncbi:DnaA regulatory inactivator Hda [Acidihalobacter ferrooxydans]|uniref:DnaA regulatory inactivator Hda n=1 Tax=Acidihalobacter ferrooxydans TaxID=1765967 RepID=UPI0018DB4119|nr:DnaA regulatory inactivator Hda [Acidihalobacter ferrooxydans]